MSLWQAVRLALAAIMANKLRSVLTMLGVIIGVFAVTTLVSIGQGATSEVTGRIQSLGSNLVTVNIRGRGALNSLSYQQALEIARQPGVAAAAPLVSGGVTLKYGNRSYETNLDGSNEEYALIRGYQVAAGRFLTAGDVQNRQRVAVLGSTVARELYGFLDPVGTQLSVNGTRFTVVGVLAEKGSTMAGSDDDRIIVPATTAERLLRTSGVRTIYVQAASPEVVDPVVTRLEAVLKRRLRDEDAYSVFNQTAMLNTVNQVTGTLTLMLGGIAGISLLVGGIGIMNIMLVSVTERTREIGIRKAIGARRRDILSQFLIESTVLSGLGGLLGVFLGVAGARLVTRVAGLATAISWPLVLLAFGFSLLVGIVFGLYPANRAAGLNPIEALRYE